MPLNSPTAAMTRRLQLLSRLQQRSPWGLHGGPRCPSLKTPSHRHLGAPLLLLQVRFLCRERLRPRSLGYILPFSLRAFQTTVPRLFLGSSSPRRMSRSWRARQCNRCASLSSASWLLVNHATHSAFFLQRKLAAMTPEERLAFATEQTNAQRREERKSRMLHTHLAGYSGAKPLSLASGRKSIAAKTSATRGATAGGASASGSAIGIAGKR